MKVSAYPPLLAADIAAGDLFLVVDVSANATKVITKAQLVTAVGGGGGSGDMTQLVYDTDGDGVINLTSIPALPESRVTNLVSDLSAKAPLASPALTATPTAPTATPGTNTTQLATTAFVTAAVAAGGGMVIGGAVTGGTAGRVLIVDGSGNLGQSTLSQDGTGTVGQRNGANPQTFNIYNTTNGTDYERGFARWSGNVFTIGTEAAGLGTVRGLVLNPGTNVLEQRNGVNPQTFRVYNTTNGTDKQWIELTAFGPTTLPTLQTMGTGSLGAQSLDVRAGQTLYLSAGGALRWDIDTDGHFKAITDNANDIGASTGSRPRTIYAGTSVVTPLVAMSSVADPAAPAAGSGVLYFRTNGGGKMEFCVRFPTGAVQVISTEP